MKKIMLDHELFLQGKKDALYGNSNSKAFIKNLHLFQNYPCVTENIDTFDADQFYLFFQTNDLKKKFLEETKGISPRSYHFHRILGLTLGFPPKAVNFFTEIQRKVIEGNQEGFNQPIDQGIGIGYAGIRCHSHIDDLIENTMWLWDKYKIEEETRIRIGSNFYYVEYQDLEGLKKVQGIKKEKVLVHNH